MAKILIVEDSPAQLEALRKLVEDQGHQAVTASNGAEGVEKAKSEKPELILMDVVMPELNGYQATRQITRDEQTKDIPVIMVTTKDQETDRVWGERQGAVAYITKPIKDDELIEHIARFLG